MKIVAYRKFAAAVALVLSVVALSTLTACGDFFVSNDSTDHVTLSATALILSSNNGVTGAESKALSATAVTVGGTSSDVTTTATWASSNAAIATVDVAGKVTAVAPGTVTISATSGGQTGSATVVIVSTAVGALTVTPGSVSLHTISVPRTQQMTALVTLGSGTLDVTQIATWTSDTTTVATVTTTGVVTSVGTLGSILGTSTAKVTATILTAAGTQSGSATITVDAL